MRTRCARWSSTASTCRSAWDSRSCKVRCSASVIWATSTTSRSWARFRGWRWAWSSPACRTRRAACCRRWSTWSSRRGPRAACGARRDAGAGARARCRLAPTGRTSGPARPTTTLRRPQMKKTRWLGAFAALAFAATAGTASAEITLRASHQFPGGKGDVRDDMVQMIAKDVKAANVGLNVQVYPGASLFKPKEQWNAMVNGQLDITLFPLDYASGKVPAFGATLMPGLIRSQDRAKRINHSQFMKDIRAEMEKHGVIVLSDAWFAGGVAGRDKCIVKPSDLQGMKLRAAGPTFAQMWTA